MKFRKKYLIPVFLLLSVLFSKAIYDFLFHNRTLYYIQPVSLIDGQPAENYYIAHTNQNQTKTILVLSDENLTARQNMQTPVIVTGKVTGLRINYDDIWGISMPYLSYQFKTDQVLQ